MTAAVLIAGDKTLRWSGGKPPFLTCKLPYDLLSFHTASEATVLMRSLRMTMLLFERSHCAVLLQPKARAVTL